MYSQQSFWIKEKRQVPDEIGGFEEKWSNFASVTGYLDLVTGTDLANMQKALVEESTHLLILPSFVKGITDDMIVVSAHGGKSYNITYADNPLELNHHNELYLTLRLEGTDERKD